ncbi:MAG: hypothetical protein JSS41_00575 [Proteobacteria bacterium]|nr:hypothetical protein [Pseudomonadota bacterium]
MASLANRATANSQRIRGQVLFCNILNAIVASIVDDMAGNERIRGQVLFCNILNANVASIVDDMAGNADSHAMA